MHTINSASCTMRRFCKQHCLIAQQKTHQHSSRKYKCMEGEDALRKREREREWERERERERERGGSDVHYDKVP